MDSGFEDAQEHLQSEPRGLWLDSWSRILLMRTSADEGRGRLHRPDAGRPSWTRGGSEIDAGIDFFLLIVFGDELLCR